MLCAGKAGLVSQLEPVEAMLAMRPAAATVSLDLSVAVGVMGLMMHTTAAAAAAMVAWPGNSTSRARIAAGQDATTELAVTFYSRVPVEKAPVRVFVARGADAFVVQCVVLNFVFCSVHAGWEEELCFF